MIGCLAVIFAVLIGYHHLMTRVFKERRSGRKPRESIYKKFIEDDSNGNDYYYFKRESDTPYMRL